MLNKVESTPCDNFNKSNLEIKKLKLLSKNVNKMEEENFISTKLQNNKSYNNKNKNNNTKNITSKNEFIKKLYEDKKLNIKIKDINNSPMFTNKNN